MEVLSFPLFFLWAPGGCVVVLLGFPSKVCFCMYPYKVSFSCLSLLAVHMFMAAVYTTCQIPTKFNESEARSLRKPSIESHVLGCYRIHTCLAVHHVFADLSARRYFLRVLRSKGGGGLNIFNLFTYLSTATTVIRLGQQLLQ